MMRSSPASSMQKTYDQCYIICSTAVYFEKQNNEDEALRSWREALDQIYYNNAFRIPASYIPKTETEKALRESLRDMEVQCKERVELLEALRQSRLESKQPGSTDGLTTDGRDRSHSDSRSQSNPSARQGTTDLNEEAIPSVNYPNLARPTLPPRRSTSGTPTLFSTDKDHPKGASDSQPRAEPIPMAPKLDVPIKKTSRTPSPEKKGSLFKSTLRPNPKEGTRHSTGKLQMTMRNRPPAAAGKAATLAWPNGAPPMQRTASSGNSSVQAPIESSASTFASDARASSPHLPARNFASPSHSGKSLPPPPPAHREVHRATRTKAEPQRHDHQARSRTNGIHRTSAASDRQPDSESTSNVNTSSVTTPQPLRLPEFPSYRREYTAAGSAIDSKKAQEIAALAHGNRSEVNLPTTAHDQRKRSPQRKKPPTVPRKAVPAATSPKSETAKDLVSSNSTDTSTPVTSPIDDFPESRSLESSTSWESKTKHLLKHLPKGVDETAAKSILNEIVVKGDIVNWDDVAGLDIAKSALKEAVVYPFLRPDLFMGLREPARGMLLFGPPGTGKTMLARAVATESKSTFFSISASSLTSKFLGESEKLVRALFALARRLAPSIIFVDEIDSLLSSRGGGGEHEATRRIKTEFLIQWSDLQKAAAGRDEKEGDASRVLVLAATNLPWAIDEAARRRFVRRQYIPLPEAHVRKDQLKRLMSRQKNGLSESDFEVLVRLTQGFSGSDITALAKDAAMGPLRSLGEQLLHMSPEDIRPIGMQDFEASLVNIRPSVSRVGLKEYEAWAREFGERGG